MNIEPYSNNIEEYKKYDEIIDYENESVKNLSDLLYGKSEDEIDYIRRSYEYVRDSVAHSADAGEEMITISASEVLSAGHGICFAKSHLLAAVLRAKGIPTGFCYQKLILDEDTAPVLIFHGLNGVYIKDLKKWIRLDARGNKPGVDAQFSLDKEQLAFPVRPEKGEEDSFIVYPYPDLQVLKAMRQSRSRAELWDDLPTELDYRNDSQLPADSCYEIDDISKVESLFEGWQETMIYSCLQRVMGKIYVTDPDAPASAMAVVGCFAFFAGEPNRELVKNKPDGFAIMVPSSEGWASLIEECIPSARRVTRYAIKKDTRFDKEALKANTSLLPVGYEIREIDGDLYDKCLENPLTYDFVSSFDDKEAFLKDGRGMVIIKNGDIVAGASSYSRYKEGIEIEVDTVPSERRKHFATIVCSALILRCLDEGLYPSWDAQNLNSVHLAEKLGYEFDHEYMAYEVESEK